MFEESTMGEQNRMGSFQNWRKNVDESLKRLHSLQFGTDAALERDDHTTAYILSLRLAGFLHSQSLKDPQEEMLSRIIHFNSASKLVAARRPLIEESDRRAFELADKAPGCVFSGKANFSADNIKNSMFFHAALQQHGSECLRQIESHQDERNLSRTFKLLKQTKLTSLYGSCAKNDLNERGNERTSNERGHMSALRPKRLYGHTNSPRNGCFNSPLSSEEADTDTDLSGNGFVTARTKMEMDVKHRRGWMGSQSPSTNLQTDLTNRSIGVRSNGFPRRGVRGNFVPPIKNNGSNCGTMASRGAGKRDDTLDDSTKKCLEMLCGPDGELPEKLRNLEPRLIEHVSNEIMDRDPNVRWEDIAGLEHAKKCVTEMVIWPLLRPDIFKGCRSPGRGLLLFGPPGTGKTMIGKAIAGEAKATFFYISASSLTSKWIGEGEKLVRALFGVASCRQPAVIFVDEIDSLLSQRKSEGEHESSRRLKTQFLIEMEGFDNGNEQILLIGATNRPQELDEAARRRLTKRLYIPLPSSEARAWIIKNLLKKDGLLKLSEEEISMICNLTQGYSGSDMKNLVKDASMGPLRDALKQGVEITKLEKDDMRAVTLQDFEFAMKEVRPSVSSNELGIYEHWNKQFGSLSL